MNTLHTHNNAMVLGNNDTIEVYRITVIINNGKTSICKDLINTVKIKDVDTEYNGSIIDQIANDMEKDKVYKNYSASTLSILVASLTDDVEQISSYLYTKEEFDKMLGK